MSLEQALVENTAAVKALTELLAKVGITTPATAAKPAAEKTQPAAEKEKPVEKKPEAAKPTEPAPTQTTAADSDAQPEKAKTSEPADDKPLWDAETRGAKVSSAVATFGREPVVKILTAHGAPRASELAADKLASFDRALNALLGA